MSPIGRRLRKARIEAKLTQVQLGVSIGFAARAASARISQWETGIHTPDFEFVAKIAKHLAYPCGYFYCVDDNEAEFLLRFHRMNPRQRVELLAKMNGLE